MSTFVDTRKVSRRALACREERFRHTRDIARPVTGTETGRGVSWRPPSTPCRPQRRRAAIDPRQVVIEGDRVTKVFSQTVVALEGATFTVEKGSFVSLVGPSGCGKSTLLRLVAGLIPMTSGRLTVHGEDVTAPRKDIGMMFQKATLLDWRTAVENVLLPSEIGGRVTNEDRRRAHRPPRHGRPQGFRVLVPAAALGRHAAARGAGAAPADGRRHPAPRRAVRRARRVHPRAAQPRAAPHRRRRCARRRSS